MSSTDRSRKWCCPRCGCDRIYEVGTIYTRYGPLKRFTVEKGKVIDAEWDSYEDFPDSYEFDQYECGDCMEALDLDELVPHDHLINRLPPVGGDS